MKNVLANFSGQVLSRGEMGDIKGGSTTTYRCEQHFHDGSYHHVKNTTVTSSSLASAEQTNDLCTVNGASCYSCCTVHEE